MPKKKNGLRKFILRMLNSGVFKTQIHPLQIYLPGVVVLGDAGAPWWMVFGQVV